MDNTGKIPRDLSQWRKAKIVEDIGSSEEHADDFYILGHLGLEQDKDGSWELYIVMGNEPIKVKGDFQSHEEAILFFEGSIARKEVVDECEDCEEEKAPVIEAEIEEDDNKSFREMMKDWVGKSAGSEVNRIYTENSNEPVPLGQGVRVEDGLAPTGTNTPGQSRMVQKSEDKYGMTPMSQMILKARGDIEFAKAKEESEKEDSKDEPKEDSKEDAPKDDSPKDDAPKDDAPEIVEEEVVVDEPAPEAPATETPSAANQGVTLAGNSVDAHTGVPPALSHVAPLPTVDAGLGPRGVVTSRGTGMELTPMRDMMAKAAIMKAEEQGYRSDGSIYGDVVLRDMWCRTTLGTDKDLPMPKEMPAPKGTDRI